MNTKSYLFYEVDLSKGTSIYVVSADLENILAYKLVAQNFKNIQHVLRTFSVLYKTHKAIFAQSIGEAVRAIEVRKQNDAYLTKEKQAELLLFLEVQTTNPEKEIEDDELLFAKLTKKLIEEKEIVKEYNLKFEKKLKDFLTNEITFSN